MANTHRDWEHFALLLIDVQRDFWSQKVAEAFPHFPSNVARLLALCRGEGIEVVHLRAHFRPDRSDWMPRYKLLRRIPCVEETPGIETLPFAVEQPGETVIIKHTFDAFFSPQLLPYLRQRGRRFVLAAGLVTSVCVFLSVASAMQTGLLTAVVEDCCADQPEAHTQTLDRYQFIFDRTTVEHIPKHYSQWTAALQQLDEC
jgi:nicotinamidase-related amidase